MPKENDDDLIEFIENLDNAGHVTVTDWESRFIETILNPKRGPLTERQRDAIKTMRDKYESEI